jgi:hypothetical protein
MKKITDNKSASQDAIVLRAVPTPRLNLKTVDDLRREMGKVYRDARGGRIETGDASRLVFILSQMGKMLELGELERRLIVLEEEHHGNT